MQELTSGVNNIYDKENKMKLDQRRSKSDEKLKIQSEGTRNGAGNLSGLTNFVYNNRRSKKDIREGGIVKNPSLLLKQILAHTESHSLKQKLVKLLINKYPEEGDVIDVINEIKDFTEFAAREEEDNNVTLVKTRIPVLDDENLTMTMSIYNAKSERNYSVAQVEELYDEKTELYEEKEEIGQN